MKGWFKIRWQFCRTQSHCWYLATIRLRFDSPHRIRRKKLCYGIWCIKILHKKNQNLLRRQVLISRGANRIWTGDQGVADPRLTAWLSRHTPIVYDVLSIYATVWMKKLTLTYQFSDSNGNRTRVTAVKGRCLNRLTMEPYSLPTPFRRAPLPGLFFL